MAKEKQAAPSACQRSRRPKKKKEPRVTFIGTPSHSLVLELARILAQAAARRDFAEECRKAREALAAEQESGESNRGAKG